jgi:hypothetical protein
VRIGRSDIVLDDEPRSRARCRRVEAGMVELEAARAVETAHEGFHDWPIIRQQAVDMRTRYRILRALGGEPVQRLVHVHHEPVQAVGAAGRDRRQLDDTVGIDFVRGLQQTLRLDGSEAIVGGSCVIGPGRLDRRDHGFHVAADLIDQLAERRRGDPPGHGHAGSAHEGLDFRRFESCGARLVLERRHSPGWSACMLGRSLQRAQAYLHAVVGRQPLGNARRQEYAGMPELLDHLSFHGDHPCTSHDRILGTLLRQGCCARSFI